jgi:aryl carrier-like protein
VLVGGEAIDPALWDAMTARHAAAGTQFFNVYGPTECTVDATIAPVASSDRPTIGRPVDHCSVYVLDAQLRLQPIGAPGELYIGGAGVARGYRNRADLTAERFVPDPFVGTPGGRMYRTGDVVWQRASGELAYVGRGDGQIKLRGYRIELEEIAAVLREAVEIRDALVLVRGAETDDARLVAYVIPEAGVAISRERLRTQLRQRLPDYMMPAAVVVVAGWPLTANGKLDAGALPDAEPAGDATAATAPEAGNDTERTIAAIWKAVLGIAKVGPHDNFFDLGGHSLRMVKVHAQLRAAFQRDIPMVELFRHPTIAALSQYFDRQASGSAAAGPERPTGASAQRGRRRAAAVITSSNRKTKRNP